MDIAFKQSGCKIAWAIEKDAACCRTYRHNFKETLLIEKDIRIVDPLNLHKVDIMTAGFPCQPFSVAGNQRGLSDPRGYLFYEVGRFVACHKPRFVFLENVSNLIAHNNGKTFNVVHDVLAELGYSIRYKVMRASLYGGVPQIRDRIYIVAFREQSDCDMFEFPNEIDLTVSIEDILKRNISKHKVYYYDKSTPFYKHLCNIVSRHDSIYRVYRDSIKVTQNRMCPTLTATMGTRPNQVHLVVDDFGLRKITIQECLDFQGFPQQFKFPHNITLEDAYKQIGNSVCVPVVKRIADIISSLVIKE